MPLSTVLCIIWFCTEAKHDQKDSNLWWREFQHRVQMPAFLDESYVQSPWRGFICRKGERM